jgi:glucosylceramidase
MHKYLVNIVILFGLINIDSGCIQKKPENPDDNNQKPADGIIEVWLTDSDNNIYFEKQSNLPVNQQFDNATVIEIDTSIQFQNIEGFGAALTGSSAHVLINNLTSPQRTSILNQLFNPQNGIGINFLRLTMGASDFSLYDFTYDDMTYPETDFDLSEFSLANDTLELLPVLKEILKINPDITILASPWSPPAWMKTNYNLKGGSLKTECYEVYAEYFVKYIEQMQENGINIKAITIQNEPLYYTANYPCMSMTWEEQNDFIENDLGPRFESAGLNTSIILYDHNWDNIDYADNILNNTTTRNYVSGTAFHGYAGTEFAMSTLNIKHPDKKIYFTEISGGEWATDFNDNLMWYLEHIFIGTTKNYASASLFWNLALNENFGPTNNGCGNCRGVITVKSNGEINKNEEFYALAHFSKFVKPNSKRTYSQITQNSTDIDAVSFISETGKKILVVSNPSNSATDINVKQNKTQFKYTLKSKSVSSFIWE